MKMYSSAIIQLSLIRNQHKQEEKILFCEKKFTYYIHTYMHIAYTLYFIMRPGPFIKYD
jgi:hypothetical protein